MADATEKETVKMQDGSTREFAGKRKMLKESFVMDDGALAVALYFRNGEVRNLVLNPSLISKFALHGAEQKYGDEVSGTDKDGKPLDPDDMVIAIDELHARLSTGEWGIKREASGISGTSVLLKALIESSGKDPVTVKEWLTNKSPAEKAALRKSSKLLPIIQRLEANKASKAANVDTDALLGELD